MKISDPLSKFFLFIVVLTSTVTANSQISDNPQVSIDSISLENNRAHLAWSSGKAPFSILFSSDLTHWLEIQRTWESRSTSPVYSQSGFFRIMESNAVAPGNFVGQLRTGEGEFNGPMELHRLKTIWDAYLPEKGSVSSVPSTYFESLVFVITEFDTSFQSPRQRIGQFKEFPESRISHSDQSMTVNWVIRDDLLTRNYSLKMDFPYNIQSTQKNIYLSDPLYTLSCRYSAGQPDIEFFPDILTTQGLDDECYLYELVEDEIPDWFNRAVNLNLRGFNLQISYTLGIPKYRGSPVFIFKTPILNSWTRTIISGLTSVPMEITSRFAQTYAPGHHNFWEYFLLDPASEPTLDESSLQELKKRNIRYILVLAGPEVSKPEIHFIGFDHSIF